MAFVDKRLFGPASISFSSIGTPPSEPNYLYSCSATGGAIIREFLITNISGQAQSITIWLKPQFTGSFSLSKNEKILDSFSIEQNSTEAIHLPLILNQNDRLYALSTSSSSTVNLVISGVEIN